MYNLMGKCSCGQWHVGGSWWPQAERQCHCGRMLRLGTVYWWKACKRAEG